jgi:hypothetical protein
MSQKFNVHRFCTSVISSSQNDDDDDDDDIALNYRLDDRGQRAVQFEVLAPGCKSGNF